MYSYSLNLNGGYSSNWNCSLSSGAEKRAVPRGGEHYSDRGPGKYSSDFIIKPIWFYGYMIFME